VGYQSLYSNLTGDNNVAVGWKALNANTTGLSNSAVGLNALLSNTSGGNNVAFGQQALQANTTASNNTAVGYQAGYSNTTGYDNTAVGYHAAYSNTTAFRNSAVGYSAGSLITTGWENICIGTSAGSWTTGITTGTNNTHIGTFTNPSAGSVTFEIVISATDAGATGKGTQTGFINPKGGGVYQGNNSSTWSQTSDQRLKKNIVDNNIGLEKIAAIQVRNFEYRVAEEITELPAHTAIEKSGVQLGVIAQELQQILPECVKTESTGVMTVDADNLTWYLVNAIKELKAEIDALKGASA
jgi:hypothetical protein